MATILPERACFVHVPRTGSSWTGAMLRSVAVEGDWTVRGPQHGTPSELVGKTSFTERGGLFCTARHPFDWLRSVWRWATAGGNFEPLPGVAALLWPTEEMGWERWLSWHAQHSHLDTVMEGYSRGCGVVLRTSHLAGDLCRGLARMGISCDAGRVESVPPANTSAASRTSTKEPLPVPSAVGFEILSRNPLTRELAKHGRGLG